MRPWLAHLVCGTALLLPALSARAQLSDKMRTQIRDSLPKFSPPPPEAKPDESAVGMPAPLSDEPVVRLPDYRVVDRGVPIDDPDRILSTQALQKKTLKEFKESMNALDWMLNRWYVPLPFGYSLTPSPQARADAAYQEKKLAAEIGRWSVVIDSLAQFDPAAARKLARDADLSRHPGD